ncbi:hypothetical protein SLEP1_g59141 [Rubroshorea leprosula]|uniref:BZIP domain-containing protein n=1 Tax=Rubroshorea leprosula TaxID=152421 RepID=A0AAV5MSJ9_9ROSI|nr:hypothetical protein SLEP1_g59141 [Rubroshorea leprosula]
MESNGQSGGESVQPINGDASQPQTLLALGCVPHLAISNQDSGKVGGTQSQPQQLDKPATSTRRKRNAPKMSEEQLTRKRMADQKSKARSKEKHEAMKSHRDELLDEVKLLKMKNEDLQVKYTAKLEAEIVQLKRESSDKDHHLEELHSRIRKLKSKLREKDDQRKNALSDLSEAEKKLKKLLHLEWKLLPSPEDAQAQRQNSQSTQSIEPPQPQDHGDLMQRQLHQPELPAQTGIELPNADQPADVHAARHHAIFDVHLLTGEVSTDAQAVSDILQAGPVTDPFLADLYNDMTQWS